MSLIAPTLLNLSNKTFPQDLTFVNSSCTFYCTVIEHKPHIIQIKSSFG